MKKTLTLLGLTSCAMFALSSCQSTDGDGYDEAFNMDGSWEETSIAGNEIPWWLMEDDSGVQIDAGERTPDPNMYPIPEGGGTASVGSTSQNQPAVATVKEPDVIVADPEPTFTTTTPFDAPAVAATPTVEKPKATTSKPKPKPKKKVVKRPKKPTIYTYTVKKGDNLSLIAARCNTTVAQIRKDSGIKGSLIYPGQAIKVRYLPKGYKADKKGRITETPSGKKTSVKGGKSHTVRKGETISGIAQRYGIPYTQILKANNMTASDAMRMRPGRKLVIPKK